MNRRTCHKLTCGLVLSFIAGFLTMPSVLADYENPAFTRGMGRMAHKDYDGAILSFTEAIGLNATNPKNYLARGKCFASMHNYDLAIQDFNKSLEYAPNDSEAYLWRGTAHANLGKDDFAIKDYEQAIKLDPALADRFFGQTGNSGPKHEQGQIILHNGSAQIIGSGKSYENKEVNTNAIRDYKQAMTRVYPQASGNVDSAVTEIHGQSPAGSRLRKQALQQNPSADLHADSENNADVSSDQSLKPARNKRITESLDADPNRGEFGALPGTRQFGGNPQKRIENMNEAIASDARNPENFFKRAKAYQKLMDVGKAISDYNEAIRLGPNQFKYYLGRASLFHQLGKTALVQADIEQARRCNPDLPQKISFQGQQFPQSVIRSASTPGEN